MAQDRFVNLTLDPAASKKPDNTNHTHGVTSGAASASGDLSISYDSSKITSQNVLASAVRAAVANANFSLKP